MQFVLFLLEKLFPRTLIKFLFILTLTYREREKELGENNYISTSTFIFHSFDINMITPGFTFDTLYFGPSPRGHVFTFAGSVQENEEMTGYFNIPMGIYIYICVVFLISCVKEGNVTTVKNEGELLHIDAFPLRLSSPFFRYISFPETGLKKQCFHVFFKKIYFFFSR